MVKTSLNRDEQRAIQALTKGVDDMEKSKWEKPELVVLVRSRPEEAVLKVCKHPQGPAIYSQGSNMGCQIQFNCLSDSIS